MKKILVTLLCIGSLFLTGCSILSPVKSAPPTAYELSSTPCVKSYKHSRSSRILVLTPDITAPYNTTAMAYKLMPYQIAYYTQSRWAATPSLMLHPLIVQTLQSTNYFKSILTPPYGGQYDYLLTTQIIKLEQDFTCTPARVIFVVRAQLGRAPFGRVIATKTFHVTQPMMTNNAYGGVVAANRATSTMLRQIAEFCMSHAR